MRIILADDHALFRETLKSLLEKHGHEVVAEAVSGLEVVKLAWEHRPDVVLMDLVMPELDGLDATKQLVEKLPEVKVLILTGIEDDEHLFDAIKAGAKGYLLKNLGSETFLQLLEGAARGEPALTPSLASRLLEEFARPRQRQPEREDPDALTARETEVLQAMVEGVTSNRMLAKRLGVSENTVKFHVRNVLDKLHLHNRAQVVAHAMRHHLVEASGDKA